MIFCSLALVVDIFMIFKLPTDPLDYGLIINEAALNISARYSNNFRYIIDLNKFKEEIKLNS